MFLPLSCVSSSKRQFEVHCLLHSMALWRKSHIRSLGGLHCFIPGDAASFRKANFISPRICPQNFQGTSNNPFLRFLPLPALGHLVPMPQAPGWVFFILASSIGLHTKKQALNCDYHAAFTQLARSQWAGPLLLPIFCGLPILNGHNKHNMPHLFYFSAYERLAKSSLSNTFKYSFPSICHPCTGTANHSIPLFFLAWLPLFWL